MSTLEIELLILIIILSVAFLAISVALIVVLLQIRRAVKKIDNILQTTEDVVEGVGRPIQMATAGLGVLMGKNRNTTIKKITAEGKKLLKKSK